MSRLRPRRLLVPGLVLAAAGAIALSVVLADDSPSPSRNARQSPALNSLPRIDRCVKPSASETGGANDEGFDVEAISARVSELRGLEFRMPVDVRLTSQKEANERVTKEFDRAYTTEVASSEQRLLAALGAIPPDAALDQVRAESLLDQVAGLYDEESKELLVVGSDDPGAAERIVLAHELTHALTDQRLGLPAADPDLSRVDSLIAEAALVEGDATLVDELYLDRHVGLDELLDSVSVGELLDLGAVASLPDYLQRELVFPYVSGAEFVCALFLRGGWREVNRAYADPPRTTAEILFPERFGKSAEDPANPGSPGPAWRHEQSGQFGAAQLLWLLRAPGGDSDRAVPGARGLVAGWAGGEFELWSRGEDTAVMIAFAERADRSGTLCAAVAGWYSAAFPEDARLTPDVGERLVVDGDDQDAVLRCPAGQVRLGIAPNRVTARRIAAPG